MYNQFDLDLPDGHFGEKLVAAIFAHKKIEVKRDFLVGKTGNIVIEYESRKKPSGIAVTTADYWALVLDGEGYNHQVIIIIETDRLKEIAREHMGDVVKGGDNHTSLLVKIPVEELVGRRDDGQ